MNVSKINSTLAFKGKLCLPVYKKKGDSIVVIPYNIDSNNIESIKTTKDGNAEIAVTKKGFNTVYCEIPKKEVPVLGVIAAYNAVKDNEKMFVDLTNSARSMIEYF